jgi:hypothetical protein
MRTILAGLTVTVIVAFVVLLAALRAGVRQQERAGSLDRRPRGLSAALARRVFGLYVRRPQRSAGHQTGPARRAG